MKSSTVRQSARAANVPMIVLCCGGAVVTSVIRRWQHASEFFGGCTRHSIDVILCNVVRLIVIGLGDIDNRSSL
jgi:hypothetical protein